MQTEIITTLETTLTELTAQRAANAAHLETARQKIESSKAGILESKPKAARELAEAHGEETVFSEESTRLDAEIARVQARIAAERQRVVESAKFDELAEIARAANEARTRYEAEFAAVGDALNAGIERLVDAALAFQAERRRFVDEVRELAPDIDRNMLANVPEWMDREMRSELIEVRKQLEARQVDVGGVASLSFAATRAEQNYLSRAWCSANQQHTPPPVKQREAILSLATEVLTRRRREAAQRMN